MFCEIKPYVILDTAWLPNVNKLSEQFVPPQLGVDMYSGAEVAVYATRRYVMLMLKKTAVLITMIASRDKEMIDIYNE